jgi:cyclophilin family peptidyl-prolyl cis-trans isomerase
VDRHAAHANPQPLPLPGVTLAAVQELRSKRLRVTMAGRGSFDIAMDVDFAPLTILRVARRAGEGYYDGLTFHRVVPGFVIQGGDPTQSGGGGPGYSTVDAPPSDAAYPQGTVAMAKSPVEAPGTSGSQFFVVTGDGGGLTPDYAIVGEVTDGLDTVLRIDALGVGDGPPSQPVVVNTVTVSES